MYLLEGQQLRAELMTLHFFLVLQTC